jgi:hypothetical protein
METINSELSSRRDLASQMNDASVTTRTIRAGIERLSTALPKRIQFYRDKMEKIELFMLELNSMEEFREVKFGSLEMYLNCYKVVPSI